MPGLLEWNVYFATVLCMVQLRSAQVSLPPFNISLCTAKDAHLYRGYPSPGVQIWTKCTYPVPGNGWHNCRGSGKALFCDPDQILSEKEGTQTVISVNHFRIMLLLQFACRVFFTGKFRMKTAKYPLRRKSPDCYDN